MLYKNVKAMSMLNCMVAASMRDLGKIQGSMPLQTEGFL